jgi:D-alanine-D-alanine ligase
VKAVRVAVLSGGRSSEHEISVASATAVIGGLREAGFEPVPIQISREGRWQLPGTVGGELGQGAPAGGLPVPTESANPVEVLGSVDVVFPVLHGPFGEDGTVQGLLELAGVAYVGPGVAASAVAMDKDLFKAVMRGNGIPVTPSVAVHSHERRNLANPFGYPVVVKPARLGSSVGISIVRDEAGLAAAVDLAFEHDDKILVEQYVTGREVECSVLGSEEPTASLVGEIVPLKADWYDFSSKYDEGGMELVVPARIPSGQAARVQELAVRSFVACGCEGMARVDLFATDDGEVLVNELNTIPGFTATSVYAKLFEASGIPYVELLERLVELALERKDRRDGLRF